MSSGPAHPGVLVGVDGSPSSRVAVRWAAHEATVRNIPLTPVHVVSTPAVSSSALSWPAVPIPAELRQWQEDEAAKVMADAIKLVEDSAAEGARPEIKSELFFSAPVPTLVDLSKETQMVGCRGRGALRRGLLGSVSTGLIHHAHCPVAVIHDKVPSSMQPVLVGIDGSPASELATAIAFDEASWRGVDLVALHTWSDAEVSDGRAWNGRLNKPPPRSPWRSASPAGKTATPTSASKGWWFGISRPAVFSTSPSRPNWSSSVATAVADSPECCSVRSALPWCTVLAFLSSSPANQATGCIR